MAVNKKSFKKNFAAKQLNYSDEFFSLKNNPKPLTDSFTVNTYEVLKDLNSLKTNNYSNLMLSKKQKNSNWLDTKTKDDKKQKNLITTISFFNDDPTDESNPGLWLYFNKNYEFWDAYVSSVEYSLTYGRPEKSYTNHIFYIDFVDDTYCTISHWFGDLKFYAKINEKLNFEFVSGYSDDCKLIYHLSEGKLRLYKKIEGETGTTLYAICCVLNKSGNWQIGLKDSEILEDQSSAIIYVANKILDFDFYTSASYIAYDRSQYIDAIDRARSAFNLDSQMLLHHEYNKEDGINFIPLKNHLTYKGHSVRGNNLSMSYPEYPDVDYRNYISINETKNQELGPENLTLNYIFNDQDFTLKEGDILTFTIPRAEDDNLGNPLYPFKYLNINDTKFIKNGAFSSDVPAFADKIKSPQSLYSVAMKDKCTPATSNNETYLCTWLYKGSQDKEPVWLDRYYYPDSSTRRDALFGKSHFAESFENNLDKNYDYTEIKNIIKEHTYVDKLSDMIIQPGNTYTYYRLSKENVDEMLENMSTYAVSTCMSNENVAKDLFERKAMNGWNSYKLDYKDFKKTNKLNVNFDLTLAPDKKMGLQIFGCDHNHGFNVQNRKDLAPLHYYATEDVIYLLNDNYKIVRSFDLKKKYNEPIVKFILSEQFDDIIIISSTSLYILSYDLKLVAKMLFNSDDVNFDPSSQSFTGLDTMIQYPYAFTHRDFTPEEIENGASKNYGSFGENEIFDYSTFMGGVSSPQPSGEAINPSAKNSVYIDSVPNGAVTAFIYTGIITSAISPMVKKDMNSQVEFVTAIEDIPIGGTVDMPEQEGRTGETPQPAGFYYKEMGDGTKRVVYFITGIPVNSLHTVKMPYGSIVSGSVSSEIFPGGSVEIISNMSKMLSSANGIMKNNNLYIPNGQYIVKCVFVPENDDDRAALGDKKMGIRVLKSGEYYVNYLRESLLSLDSTEIAMENGFIEVENTIKHVYIDKDGTIYGLNFDQFSVSPDHDTIYGLYANQNYINSGGYFWIFNQSLAKIKSSVSTSKFAEFGSAESIDYVCCDDADNMLLVRNTTKIDTDNTDPVRFEVYDRTKRKVYSRAFEEGERVLSVDAYRFIDDDMKERRVFSLVTTDLLGNIKVTQYDTLNKNLLQINTQLPGNYNKFFYQTTNSPSLMNYSNENKLYFNLYFPSGYIYNHKAEIVWDISDVQEGIYNINAEIDIDKAKFEIKINDEVFETIGENEWFIPYVESNGTMFTDTYFIGCLGKKYGSTLNKILKRKIDPYMCKNTAINRCSVYRKVLSFAEYEAMRLKDNPINELTLTLPCGTRSNIEEITRYFKYAYPGAISNRVKLNISGTGLESEGELSSLRKEIEAAVAESKDCIVDIKDINFVK